MSDTEETTGESTSDRPEKPGFFTRAYDSAAEAVDRKVGWYKLPKALGLLDLIGIRNILREKNLYDTSRMPAVNPVEPPPFDEAFRTQRTFDGSWNDLEHPEMGMAGTRFGRNVPIADTWPTTDRILEPNPREVSRRLMTRGDLIPAAGGNALIAAWLQFMIHDWFRHGTSPKDNPWVLPAVAGDDWPTPPVQVMRTPVDTTMPPDSDQPPTHVNILTHWWDGSQIYGNSLAEQEFLRSHEGGKLKLVNGLPPIPDDPTKNPTLSPGFWLGLGMLQTLFVHEHNSICEMLSEAYPEWDDETTFQRARLINAALLAKIHTVEWTPAVTAHPTAVTALHANWWGLEGKRLHDVFGRLSKDEAISGIPGSQTADYGVPFALTEEFVAVYRMHPLIPDHFDFRSATDDAATIGPKEFDELSGPAGADVLRDNALTDLMYTFGTMNPGLVTLHNFPKYLQTFKRPDNGELMDLAAVDILRSRELGVPRYSEFRRLLHLPVPESFDDITSNKEWAAELSDVYGGDLSSVDLISGMFAEDRPEGFAFSDTAFRIFILMASRRLNSDRFFTTHFTDEVYTSEGMEWIKQNTMLDVLRRQCPELVPTLQDLPNAFALWSRRGAEQ
ncbi:heme peroxidase [Jatrophihabitans sp. GAS493]|uniref:peroxidase family protein n=1 Tax=Jatrophihabitans sp. GAS493 TaxID=1907575 RepID=UPI000BB68656|nr:peroxidase family protein [Jatrophihabitans sp. GAS493]SOD74556.1 heme peroxidase [Jatrophihabitans sp. GAS493]